jgi:Ca2+-transporting ATPase
MMAAKGGNRPQEANMSETETGELLLRLAALFGLTFALGGLLEKLRIPGILGALFVAMAAHYFPLGTELMQPAMYEAFSFLAQIGVLFLLFFIGLQIDLVEMRTLSRDIVWATVLNTAVPFLLGVVVMLALGYSWIIAFVIGLTRMPTAEAVIVPILDEFQMVRTRVGGFIIGAGVLDYIIEVFLIAFVSVWIGEKTLGAVGAEREMGSLIMGIGIFIAIA